MAQGTVSSGAMAINYANLPDKRKVAVAGGVQPNSVLGATFYSATKDVVSMRTALTAYNSTVYPAAVLDAMTANDMVSALRFAYESAGMF